MADPSSSAKTTTTGNVSKNSASRKSFVKINKKFWSTSKIGGSKSTNVKQLALLSLPHKIDMVDHHNRDDRQPNQKPRVPKQQEKIGSTLTKSKFQQSGGSLFDVRSKLSKVSHEKAKTTTAQKSKILASSVEQSKATTTTPMSVVDRKKATTTLTRPTLLPKSPELQSNLWSNEPDVIISKSFQFSSAKSFDHRHSSRKVVGAAAPLAAAAADAPRKEGASKINIKKPAPPLFSPAYFRQIFECLRNQSLVAWLTIAVLSVVLCLVLFYAVTAVKAFRAPEPAPPLDYY